MLEIPVAVSSSELLVGEENLLDYRVPTNSDNADSHFPIKTVQNIGDKGCRLDSDLWLLRRCLMTLPSPRLGGMRDEIAKVEPRELSSSRLRRRLHGQRKRGTARARNPVSGFVTINCGALFFWKSRPVAFCCTLLRTLIPEGCRMTGLGPVLRSNIRAELIVDHL